MADGPEAFRRKADAMFARADRQLQDIGRVFVLKIAADLIVTTPGPNLQFPYDTEYIATGRLRAGWSWQRQSNSVASRWDGGPYTEHGNDTLAAIEGSLPARLPTISYLENDVAYGYIVHEGLGRHKKARPWVQITALKASEFAREAISEVMSR